MRVKKGVKGVACGVGEVVVGRVEAEAEAGRGEGRRGGLGEVGGFGEWFGGWGDAIVVVRKGSYIVGWDKLGLKKSLVLRVGFDKKSTIILRSIISRCPNYI